MNEEQKKFYNTSEEYFKLLSEHPEESFKEYIDFVSHYARPGATVLDEGCGTGQAAKALGRRGFKVTGVDGSERFINYAQQRFPDVDFKLGDLLELPFTSGSFDIVASFNTLEHVTDVPKALAEALRVLKLNGLLLIHSPNLLSAKHMLNAYRLKTGRTFEGDKTNWELLRDALRNINWLMRRTITQKPKFIYREPLPVFKYADNDATVFLNPIDLRLTLESLGAKIISYQAVPHLPQASFLKRLGSRFFPEHMGIIRIVAKKSARYERH